MRKINIPPPWVIERRKPEVEQDQRLPLYLPEPPLPERAPERETEFVVEF